MLCPAKPSERKMEVILPFAANFASQSQYGSLSFVRVMSSGFPGVVSYNVITELFQYLLPLPDCIHATGTSSIEEIQLHWFLSGGYHRDFLV
jgi:hypothetical protein